MKVFISYKWEGARHNKWVERFARDLRSRGIDALLDKWEVRLGQSFTDYMTSAISSVDAVLFVMTPASLQAAEAPSGNGGAVKFEMQLATARRIAGEKFRFIGILRGGDRPVKHLRDSRYIDFRDNKRYGRMLDELVADLLGYSDRPLLPDAFTTEIVFTLGAELDATRLRGRFATQSEDIVIWNETESEGEVAPIAVYRKSSAGYVPRPIDAVSYATRVSFDYLDRLIIVQEREGVHVVTDTGLLSRLPIAATDGDPIISSEVAHPRQPIVAIGTHYGQVVAWDYERDEIKFARRYFPRKDIVWITGLAIDDVANEILFCHDNVLYRARMDDGELVNKTNLGPSQEITALAIHKGADLLAVGSVANASLYELSSLRLLHEIRIGGPMVSQLTFSRHGKLLGLVYGMGISGGGSQVVDTSSGLTLAKFNEVSFRDIPPPKNLFSFAVRSIDMLGEPPIIAVGDGSTVTLHRLTRKQ